MEEKKEQSYTVRVELLRPRETSYSRLERDMYRKGFRHLIKDRQGQWVRLPKGSFVISTNQSLDNIRRTVTTLAIALDETALVKTAPLVSWAA